MKKSYPPNPHLPSFAFFSEQVQAYGYGHHKAAPVHYSSTTYATRSFRVLYILEFLYVG